VKSIYLNELDARKLFVVFIQESEELRLLLVWNLTISSPSLKAVSSNASPG
jgi:hypothetical protein